MITIKSRFIKLEEYRYVYNWVFQEVLGHSIRFEHHEKNDTSITLEDSVGELRLADAFFSCIDKYWLKAESLPIEPLKRTSDDLPIFYSKDEVTLAEVTDESSSTNLDILGTIFFLITCYEEAVTPKKDLHERFSSQFSILTREGILNRAVGNEYIELLWGMLISQWPQLKRKERHFRLLPSHDIDHPTAYWNRTLLGKLKRAVRSYNGHRQLKKSVTILREGLTYPNNGWKEDPFDTINWIMEQSEENNLQSAFYYIPYKTNDFHDPGMPLDSPQVVDQWKRILSRGHELGIHPGYDTFNSPSRMAKSFKQFRQSLELQEIHLDCFGGRQHILRWDSSITPSLLDANGMDYDSTLGFADQAGFRTGVCYEFPMYDMLGRKPLKLRQRPLLVMDCSILDERYMNLSMEDEAYSYINTLKEECKKYSGDFTILWHNQRFYFDPRERDFYSSLLKG